MTGTRALRPSRRSSTTTATSRRDRDRSCRYQIDGVVLKVNARGDAQGLGS